MITLTHYLVLVHRADAFGGELQLYRLLAALRRYCRTDFRILRTDRCRCRIRHRSGNYGAGVPQPTND